MPLSLSSLLQSTFKHFQTYHYHISIQLKKFHSSLTPKHRKLLLYATIVLFCILGTLLWIFVLKAVLIFIGVWNYGANATEMQRAKKLLNANQLNYETLGTGNVAEFVDKAKEELLLQRQGSITGEREKNPCFSPKSIQIVDETKRMDQSDADTFFFDDEEEFDSNFFGQSFCQRIVPQQKEYFFKSDKLKITVWSVKHRKLLDGFMPLCLTMKNLANSQSDAPRLNILYHVKEVPDVEALPNMENNWGQTVNKRRWNDVVDFVEGAVSAGFTVRVILVKAYLWTDSLHQMDIRPNAHVTHVEHKIVKGADNVRSLKGDFEFDPHALLYTATEARNMLPPQVELVNFDAHSSSHLDVLPVNDLFVAYNDWSMAFLAHQAMEDLGRSHFLYYLNKYEPGELGGGVEQAFAFEALSLPHYLVTYSPELHTTLKAYKQGVFETGNSDRYFTLNRKSTHSILDNPEMLSRLETRLKSSKKRRMLIHGCHEHEYDNLIFSRGNPTSDRCGYYLVLQALSRAVNSGVFDDLSQWEFHTTGEESHKDGYKAFSLITGITIVSPQELRDLREMTKTKEEFVEVDRKIYADFSSYDIVLALDISTLITPDQLNAASSGVITIVNELDVKKASIYKRYGANFVPTVPGVQELSKAIECAVSRVNDFLSRANGSQNVEKYSSMWQHHHVESLQSSVKELLQCKWMHHPGN